MTSLLTDLDPVEQSLAIKRVARWSHGDKEFVLELTPAERELVLTLVALLDVRPCDELVTDR